MEESAKASLGQLVIYGGAALLIALGVAAAILLTYWLLGRRRRGSEVTLEEDAGVSEE